MKQYETGFGLIYYFDGALQRELFSGDDGISIVKGDVTKFETIQDAMAGWWVLVTALRCLWRTEQIWCCTTSINIRSYAPIIVRVTAAAITRGSGDSRGSCRV